MLLFPCNDFANQEPRQNQVIKQFALSKGVDLSPESPVFMFSKLRVLGACKSDAGCKPDSRRCCASEDPIYNDYLAKNLGVPSWNFAKYLVSKDGTDVWFFESRVEPQHELLVQEIERELATEG